MGVKLFQDVQALRKSGQLAGDCYKAVPQTTGLLTGAQPWGSMKMAKSGKEGTDANRRRSGLEGHRLETSCQQVLFAVESPFNVPFLLPAMRFKPTTFWLACSFASVTSHSYGSFITFCSCPSWPQTGSQYSGDLAAVAGNLIWPRPDLSQSLYMLQSSSATASLTTPHYPDLLCFNFFLKTFISQMYLALLTNTTGLSSEWYALKEPKDGNISNQ